MSEAKPQQEPSMEEILASIRRIISDDGEEGAPAADDTGAAAEPAAEAEEDVLELTQVVDEEPAAEPEDETETEPAAAEPEEAPEEEAALPDPPDEPDPEAVPSEDDEIELREEIQPAEPAAPAEAPAPVEAPAEGNQLISDAPAAATTGSLSNLAAAVDMAHATAIGTAGRGIEDLVKEVVRPMVKEWLDANLPGLVERLVEREISRLSRNAEGDD